MQLLKILSLTLLLLLPSLEVKAEIHEIKYMFEVEAHLEPDTLVLFNIDNTLMEPVQELGSAQWLKHRIREYHAQGETKANALDLALSEWVAIQNLTEVRLVERKSDTLIKDIQADRYRVMGLTTRGPGISTRTARQLKSIAIDFSDTAPIKDDFFFTNVHGILFRKGILFTAGTNQGEALRIFLDKISYYPTKIVYVNDKASQLKDVQQACDKMGISFAGLRYGYLDEKVKSFRQQIAEVQLYFFGKLLSDEAAERVLHNSP